MVSKKVYNSYKKTILCRISRIRKQIKVDTGIFPKAKIFISPGFSASRPIIISDIADGRIYHYPKKDECYRMKNGVLVRVGGVVYG